MLLGWYQEFEISFSRRVETYSKEQEKRPRRRRWSNLFEEDWALSHEMVS